MNAPNMTTTKPRRANLRPPGKCIFCDRPGLTREHMWADWLRNYIQRTMQEHVVGDVTIFPTQQEETVKRRTGDPHSRRIKCVCRPCNNEWMSQLQEDTKRFLLPMLAGHETVLRKIGQTTLASWITMMVMVSEYIDLDKIAVSAADRRWFYLNRRPPSHWRIWIGRHGREKYPLFVHNVLSCATEEKFERSSSNSAAELNTQTSTICLGEHLLIHVMSSPTARSIIRRWKLPSGMEGALNQIWPIRNSAVAWPPSLIITDAGIDTLAQQFVIAAVNVLKRRMGTI